MSESSPPPAAGGSLAPLAASKSPSTARTLALLALLAAALALIFALYLVRRTSEMEQRIAEEHAQAAAHDQRSADLERRLAELERQWTQAQSEAEAAPGLASDAELRRHRETLALLDIERLVEQTQLQLRLGASTSVAIDALLAADARLSRVAGSNAPRVQTALRHDLARLRAAPDVDRGALAARLDPLLAAVDSWHLTADVTHSGLRASGPPAPAPANAPALPPAESIGARVRAWIESEFGDLVRIRQVSTPEALLLSPVQQQLVRERFRLGVLDLRQAILARDERMVRAEEAALEDLLVRYFDPRQPAVAAALAQLRATAGASAASAPVSLEETLSALRAARGTADHAGNG